MFESGANYGTRVRLCLNGGHIAFFLPVVAILLLFAGTQAKAQLLFGSIVGNATDASGAAVPGAAVTVTQLETNESRDTKTNEAAAMFRH